MSKSVLSTYSKGTFNAFCPQLAFHHENVKRKYNVFKNFNGILFNNFKLVKFLE